MERKSKSGDGGRRWPSSAGGGRRLLLLALLAYLAAVGLNFDRQRLYPAGFRDELRFAPPYRVAEFLCLDHRGLAADLFFIRVIQHTGSLVWKPLTFAIDSDWKYALIDLATRLDPQYYSAYLFAGMGMIQEFDDIYRAEPILKRGCEAFPESWELPFWLGYDFYVYQNDYAVAARYLWAASEKPKAPKGFLVLLLKALREQGAYAQAQIVMTKMAAAAANPTVKELYRKKSVRFANLARLQAAAKRFITKRGRPPVKIAELVASGLIAKLPADPFGRPYLWDAQQRRVVVGKAPRKEPRDAREPAS
jgi:tetratricopeptide (TPR) repeat protein